MDKLSPAPSIPKPEARNKFKHRREPKCINLQSLVGQSQICQDTPSFRGADCSVLQVQPILGHQEGRETLALRHSLHTDLGAHVSPGSVMVLQPHFCSAVQQQRGLWLWKRAPDPVERLPMPTHSVKVHTWPVLSQILGGAQP